MSGPARPASRRDTAILVAVAFLCAWLTIAITGHKSGDNNNVFHLPILVGLYDHPGFDVDTFVQSTRHYASGFWMLLRGVADRETMLSVLLPLQVASRFLFFVGVLAMARPLGIAGRPATSIFLLLVALATPLRGFAVAGGGGLLIPAFTHSEVANATTLIALALAMRGRFGWAIVAAGCTFFINMFMAVWLAPALVVLALLALRRGTTTVGALVAAVAWGGLACVPLVGLVLCNLLSNPDFGQPVSFDYRAYLIDYWPYHFLVELTPARELAKLAGMAVTGLVVARALEARARDALTAILTAYITVWLTGAVVSLATAAPIILNLHLLRSSALLIIVAVITIAAVAARWATADRAEDRWCWAPLLMLLLTLRPILAVLCPLVVVLRSYLPTRMVPARPAIAIAAVALVAAATGQAIRDAVRHDTMFRNDLSQWVALADWAHAHTPPGATFLLPVANFNPVGSLPIGAQRDEDLVPGAEVFVARADRPLWVGLKQGAAAMWSPGYHAEWQKRVTETLPLPDLSARIGYARRHGIAVVVGDCAPDGPAPIYRGARLCGYAASPPTSRSVRP